MGQSKKDLRNQRQRAEREAGIVHLKKDPSCFVQTVCTICKGSFRTTKNNIELHSHWLAKHSEHPFNKIFPGHGYIVNGVTYTPPEEVEAASSSSPAAPAK